MAKDKLAIHGGAKAIDGFEGKAQPKIGYERHHGQVARNVRRVSLD